MCDVIWKDVWTEFFLEKDCAIKCTTPSDDYRILQAVTQSWESLKATVGPEPPTMTNATSSSPCTATSQQMAGTNPTSTWSTPASRTSGDLPAPAVDTGTFALRDWLLNEATPQGYQAGDDRYCYIFRRQGEEYRKSCLKKKVDPGTLVMGLSLLTVTASGEMKVILDMKKPITQDSPEFAVLETTEKAIRQDMLLNFSQVKEVDSWSKNDRERSSSRWASKRRRQY